MRIDFARSFAAVAIGVPHANAYHKVVNVRLRYSTRLREIDMEWQGREESGNVEDRRGLTGQQLGVAGGLGGIVVVILGLVFGLNRDQAQQLVDVIGLNKGDMAPGQKRELNPAEIELGKFSKTIMRDTEVIWGEQFAKMGKKYVEPKLVLFTDRVQSACGNAGASVGPFYCPSDQKVYIDLSFYNELDKKLGAPGEFARAYVLAHEVGHHVQNLLGYSARVDEVRQKHRSNDHPEVLHMSVRLELQADYFAGVWAYHGQKKYNFLQSGDIESAMNAANQIGDDTLQKKATGTVRPESFTHGSSRQRTRWFKAGAESGDVAGAKRIFDMRYEDL